MDTKATLDELKLAVKQFCEERDWDQFHRVKDLAIGAATESAELLEIFRFKTDDTCDEMIQNSPEDRKNIADELADILFFVVRIAQKYNIELSQAFDSKMEKNRLKYPIEKSRGSNKKYTEL
jgi:NTP pyrophosphatase (non-canonical NTP hydrolase)